MPTASIPRASDTRRVTILRPVAVVMGSTRFPAPLSCRANIGNELNGFEGLFMLIGGLMCLGGLFLPGLFMLGFALIMSAAVLGVLRNVKDDLF